MLRNPVLDFLPRGGHAPQRSWFPAKPLMRHGPHQVGSHPRWCESTQRAPSAMVTLIGSVSAAAVVVVAACSILVVILGRTVLFLVLGCLVLVENCLC